MTKDFKELYKLLSDDFNNAVKQITDKQWESFDTCTWCQLLIHFPSLWGHCERLEIWRKFTDKEWYLILFANSYFINIALQHHGLEKLSSKELGQLACMHPNIHSFLDAIQFYNKFSVDEWYMFLLECPSFITKCKDDILKQLNTEQYVSLLCNHPYYFQDKFVAFKIYEQITDKKTWDELVASVPSLNIYNPYFAEEENLEEE